MMLHFGVEIKEKSSNRINKETYLSAEPEGMRGWEEKHYIKQRIKAEINYEASMRYFASLDSERFNKCIQNMCMKHKFIECTDLNEVKGKQGIYVLVLDEYKQIYIGKTTDIKKRILSHWSKEMPLERLIFGKIENSIISINSFGALDTTRIFYKQCDSYEMDVLEEKLVTEFQGPYLCNRTAGGIGSIYTYTNDAVSAQLAVAANMTTRNLEDFFD